MTDGELGRRALECLARAGWTADRRIDPGPQVERLEAEGYTVSATVRDFLSRFGGLRLRYPHFRVPSSEDSCSFDAAQAAGGISELTVAEYAKAVGSPVCPVGRAFNEHMTLLMTGRGVVYAGYEDTLIRLAGNPLDAVNELCEGRDEHEQIPLPGWFDARRGGLESKGSALDDLLAQAAGPTGPGVEVDLGMPGLFAELSALLTRCNGFTAFAGALQVFRVGEPGEGPELWAWNEPEAWKDAYGTLADNLLCFAQGSFGEQHSFDLAHGGVVVFDPETGYKEYAGESLAAWAQWLFEFPGVNMTDAWVRSYQDAHGPLSPDQRLVPIRPFQEGGEYELANFTAADGLQSLRSRGPEAQRRRAAV